MYTFKRHFGASVLIGLIVALTGGAQAQQASTDIWRMVPPNSLVLAAFDGRPDNPSVQVITKAQNPQARELQAKQRLAMHKAIEDFATLFGVSLDFAKDVASWEGQQWAFVLLPDGKDPAQPVFVIASKDSHAADAALRKLIAPWQRAGNPIEMMNKALPYPVTAFKVRGADVYASAFGPVVAFSPSMECLFQVLKGGGFAPGSAGEKVCKALSGSMFYAFVDPEAIRRFKIISEEIPFPVTGLGLGVSAVDTGTRIRLLGYPDENGAAFLKQVLSAQATGTLSVNPGIPSACLVAASLPNLSAVAAMAGAAGLFNSPIFGPIQAVSDTQLSAAITAVLPVPAGVVSAIAAPIRPRRKNSRQSAIP